MKKKLIRTQIALLNRAWAELDVGGNWYICYILEDVAHTSKEVKAAEKLKDWIADLLEGYASLGSWLHAKGYITGGELWANAYEQKPCKTRMAWIEWMIEQLEEKLEEPKEKLEEPKKKHVKKNKLFPFPKGE